jgi:hypothetical protein
MCYNIFLLLFDTNLEGLTVIERWVVGEGRIRKKEWERIQSSSAHPPYWICVTQQWHTTRSEINLMDIATSNSDPFKSVWLSKCVWMNGTHSSNRFYICYLLYFVSLSNWRLSDAITLCSRYVNLKFRAHFSSTVYVYGKSHIYQPVVYSKIAGLVLWATRHFVRSFFSFTLRYSESLMAEWDKDRGNTGQEP